VKIPDNIFAEIKFPSFSKILSNYEIWKDGILMESLQL